MGVHHSDILDLNAHGISKFLLTAEQVLAEMLNDIESWHKACLSDFSITITLLFHMLHYMYTSSLLISLLPACIWFILFVCFYFITFTPLCLFFFLYRYKLLIKEYN